MMLVASLLLLLQLNMIGATGRVEKFTVDVLDWNPMHKPHPTLVVRMPSKHVFAPVRFILMLSWRVESTPDPEWISVAPITGRQVKLKIDYEKNLVIVELPTPSVKKETIEIKFDTLVRWGAFKDRAR